MTGKKRTARFQVTQGCGECRDCLDNFGCPAMYLESGEEGQLADRLGPVLRLRLLRPMVRQHPAGGGEEGKRMILGEGQGLFERVPALPQTPSPTREEVAPASHLCLKAGMPALHESTKALKQ